MIGGRNNVEDSGGDRKTDNGEEDKWLNGESAFVYVHVYVCEIGTLVEG